MPNLQAVGPAIAPDVTYHELEYVQDGGAASYTFEKIAKGCCTGEETILRRALEEYCRRDTFAMVEVHRKLLKLVS
jgi:hypothetical protein